MHKIATIALLRWKGEHSEEEIAKKVGFGSSEAMHQQLRNWEAQGLLSGGPSTGERAARERKARASRRGEGKAIELPPAAGAEELFQEALGKLDAQAQKLRGRKE